MKKKICAITLCSVISLSLLAGCASSINKLADTAKTITEKAENSKATATPDGPTPTPAPKKTELALKKAGKVGDWKFTVTKVTTKKKIQTSKYMEATADKGNLLVIVSMSVTNKGKKRATFLPRVGRENEMISAKLIYKDGYEYQPSFFASYDKDLIGKEIDPLTKKKGVIAFNVPKKVAKAIKSCKIHIGTTGEFCVYSIK